MMKSIKYWERYGFFNMNFKLEILFNFEILGCQICQQIEHKIIKFHSSFQLKLKWEGTNIEF